MRLIHTSDWHLGQSLHGHERSDEHRRFLAWLLDILVAQQADALLIAGDVFDNANPSAAAQKELYGFLTSAHSRLPKLQILLIAGNHDSPGRLEAPAPFLALFDAAVVGQSRGADGRIDPERLVLPLKDATGAIAAWCLAVPFLRPGDVPKVDGEGDPYLAGIALLYRQALAVALARRQGDQALIAMGHCHMVHGQISADSERPIVIGGAEAVPTTVFGPEITYAALGHLHLAQKVAGQEHLRYSGSPLPLSFAELGYRHQVLCVDLDGATLQGVTPIPVPRFVDLLRIPEQPGPVEQVLAQLQQLTLPERPLAEQPYLEVRMSLSQPEPDLRSRVEAALADKPVRLARIDSRAQVAGSSADLTAALSLDDLQRLEPAMVFQQLCRQKLPEGDIPPPLLAAFAELLHDPL